MKIFLREAFRTAADDSLKAYNSDALWQVRPAVHKHWEARKVSDLKKLMPYTELNAFPEETTLAKLASEYRMHPFMIAWWASRLSDACRCHGEELVKKFMDDECTKTLKCINKWEWLYTKACPPSPYHLVKAMRVDDVAIHNFLKPGTEEPPMKLPRRICAKRAVTPDHPISHASIDDSDPNEGS